MAELPEALHIPTRLIEAVSVLVFSVCELPPDYRETAVPPHPASVTVQRVTTKTNVQLSLELRPAHLSDDHSISQTVSHLHNDH